MLKEKIKAGVNYVKNHKKETAIILGTVVVGGVVYVITKQRSKNMDKAICMASDGMSKYLVYEKSNFVDLEIPKLDVGTIDELWTDKFGTNLILNDVTVSDLGKIGEEFKKINGITDETAVTAVVGLLDKMEKVVEL